MDGEQGRVVVLAQAHQGGAQHRPLGEVERPQRLAAHHPLELRLARRLGQRRQVHQGHRDLRWRLDDLHRLAVDRGVAGAQDLVAADHRRHGAAQRRPVQEAPQAEAAGDVVGMAPRLELVEEPQALLRKGQGEGRRPRDGADRRRRGDPAGRFGGGGQAGHRRLLEQGAQRQVDVEGGARAGHDLSRQQGVAAQGEEVVVATDAGEPEDLGPDAGHQLFGRGARRAVVRFAAARGRGLRQRFAVHLSLRRARQLGEDHEGCRHHVRRQPFLQEGAQGGGRWRLGPSSAATHATRWRPTAASSRTPRTQVRTSGCPASTASISSSSMRKPRILI